VIKFTLLTDGSSDKVLLPILKWTIRQHRAAQPIEDQFADLRLLHRPPETLADKIVRSIELYPCQILFVHRDSEKATHQTRKEEIYQAFNQASEKLRDIPPLICIVPIRMQEAWLLFDEQAIRNASGNPNGKITLELPVLREVENMPNPKSLMYSLLSRASELHGRRLKDFNSAKQAHRVAELIDNFEPLRQLSAFQLFEDDLQQMLNIYFPI